MKTGKTAKDIFAPTASTAPPAAAVAATSARRPGRPATHDEPWTKATVVLFDRQIVWLDRLATDIRAATGAAVNRAEIIRALIDAASAADLDLSRAGSESELKAQIARLLAGHDAGGAAPRASAEPARPPTESPRPDRIKAAATALTSADRELLAAMAAGGLRTATRTGKGTISGAAAARLVHLGVAERGHWSPESKLTVYVSALGRAALAEGVVSK